MMRINISWGVLAVSLACGGVGLSRTVFNSGEGTFIAGKIVGRVETILNDLSLPAEQKKTLLEGELIHAEQLHLESLSQKIRSHLSLATVQMDTYSAHRLDREELPLQSALLGEESDEVKGVEGEEEEQQPADKPLSVEQISVFGSKVIESAASYSDRLSIAGVPSVSQHRMASFALFMKQLRRDPEALARGRDAVAVCKKIYELLESNRTLLNLIASFKNHLSAKYGQTDAGVEGDINFKIFEVVAYPTPEEGMSVLDSIGGFLASYNSYVAPEYHFAEEDLSFPAQDWAHTILNADSVVKHVMLLISFAMEQVKYDIQRTPLIKQLQTSVRDNMAHAVTLLETDGVDLKERERLEPLALAIRCSDHVQTILASGGGSSLSRVHSERVEEYVNIADQINQLTSDYDMVVREMADSAALERLSKDISQLSGAEQQLLRDSSSIDHKVLQEMVPAFSEEQSVGEGDQSSAPFRRKKRTTAQKVGMGVGIAASIMFVLWQAVPMIAKQKATPSASNPAGGNGGNTEQFFSLWDYLSDIKTPWEFGTQAVQSVTAAGVSAV